MTLPIRNSRIRLTHGQIFSREVGEGFPVVFLHGSWQDSSQWLSVIGDLSLDYHCLAPDLLGCGESERPKLHYSIELQVESLADYLTALNLKQVMLVGHEVGGWIAASYALAHPHQVRGLVLLGPEGVVGSEQRDRWRMERWLMQRPPLFYGMLRGWLPLAHLLGQRPTVQRLLARRQQIKRSPAVCQLLFQRRRAEIQAEVLGDRLAWLKLPVLIVQGDQDTGTPVMLNRMYAQAPDSRLEIVPGSTTPWNPDPTALVAAIHAWLARVIDG